MVSRKIIFSFLIITILVITRLGCRTCEKQPPEEIYLVLYAFSAEGEHLAKSMEVQKVEAKLGRKVHIGTLSGKNIVLAETGIGMTNAAMTAQTMIDRYNPKAVLFSGIAGGIDSTVHIGDIVVPEIWIEHDYGYYGAKGFESNPVPVFDPLIDSLVQIDSFFVSRPLLDSMKTLDKAEIKFQNIGDRRPQVIVGGIGVSGNAFIDNVQKRKQLFDEFGALITDMESVAVAQVCLVNEKPFLILRSASDLAGGSGSATADKQLDEFFRVAADNSAALLKALLQVL